MTKLYDSGTNWGQVSVDALKRHTTKVELDLEGLDGNAFSLIGAYRKAGKRQNIPLEILDKVIKEATSGDYDHLLQTLLANTK